MPYVSRFERIVREEGREEGAILVSRQMVVDALECKFGEGSVDLKARVEKLTDVAMLRKINILIMSAATIEELEKLVP